MEASTEVAERSGAGRAGGGGGGEVGGSDVAENPKEVEERYMKAVGEGSGSIE